MRRIFPGQKLLFKKQNGLKDWLIGVKIIGIISLDREAVAFPEINTNLLIWLCKRQFGELHGCRKADAAFYPTNGSDLKAAISSATNVSYTSLPTLVLDDLAHPLSL